MTLQEAIAAGLRLAVAVQRDFEVLAAEVYVIDDGVAFLDIGWSEPVASSFRAHVMDGEIGGIGPWTVGSWRIREIDPETDPEYLEEWERWEQFKAETDATRERGAEYASQMLERDVQA